MIEDIGRSPAEAGSGCQPTASAANASSLSGIPNAETRFVAPWTPPERMWGGLARDIMMAMSFSGPLTPRVLLKHLKRIGAEIPRWLRDEGEMKSLDHAISKGTRCVLIYRAMLWDGRSLHLTPSGHTADCEFHCDQYPHECTCGATLSAAQAIEAGTAETVKLGSVHESAVGETDAPNLGHSLDRKG